MAGVGIALKGHAVLPRIRQLLPTFHCQLFRYVCPTHSAYPQERSLGMVPRLSRSFQAPQERFHTRASTSPFQPCIDSYRRNRCVRLRHISPVSFPFGPPTATYTPSHSIVERSTQPNSTTTLTTRSSELDRLLNGLPSTRFSLSPSGLLLLNARVYVPDHRPGHGSLRAHSHTAVETRSPYGRSLWFQQDVSTTST
jgi:hypothetical protein